MSPLEREVERELAAAVLHARQHDAVRDAEKGVPETRRGGELELRDRDRAARVQARAASRRTACRGRRCRGERSPRRDARDRAASGTRSTPRSSIATDDSRVPISAQPCEVHVGHRATRPSRRRRARRRFGRAGSGTATSCSVASICSKRIFSGGLATVASNSSTTPSSIPIFPSETFARASGDALSGAASPTKPGRATSFPFRPRSTER